MKQTEENLITEWLNMVQPNIIEHELKLGELSFTGSPEKPLKYYTGKAGSRGILNMTLKNEGEEFIIIPVKQ